jgi:hypothetical protein
VNGVTLAPFAPAVIRRAFFVAGWLAAATALLAAPPAATPPPLSQVGKLDPAQARAALEQLRRQGPVGNYFLEFQLRVMPRRGEERLLSGRMWGGRNEQGPLTRVSISEPDGRAERRLLIQNGPHAAVWRWSEGRAVQPLNVAALFEPVDAGTQLTPFDLEMPFLFWTDFTYEGMQRYRGRPAHVLLLRPPAAFAAQHPALQAVRVYLDTQFNALVQTEQISGKGGVLKTLSLLDLKKVGEQWIPKTLDSRNEQSHDKTRLSVTGAALNLEFSPVLFEPAQLAERVQPPASAQIERVEP